MLRSTPVATFLMLTLAFATAAPLGSVTTPRMVPPASCARIGRSETRLTKRISKIASLHRLSICRALHFSIATSFTFTTCHFPCTDDSPRELLIECPQTNSNHLHQEFHCSQFTATHGKTRLSPSLSSHRGKLPRKGE